MTINLIANFQTGYVGEVGDANHLAREMEALGHTVKRVPQDIWREYVRGSMDESWKDRLPIKANISIICKWHQFDAIDISALKPFAPVFYWVWDYMQYEPWHLNMVRTADLYLGNDVRSGEYDGAKNCYYFPFDVADGEIPQIKNPKIYDVAFFGSWIDQGNRQKWLTEINKTNPITVFSWNYQDWPKEFDARPAVYGEAFNREVSQSKIVLGFSVEANCWGYWSNRVGKTLLAGGFLLQQYAPGMELFLRDGVEYFSNIEEAREKIDHYLIAESERQAVVDRGLDLAHERFSSKERVKDLMILIERYLKKGDIEWQI
jgi:hypothetical protein